MLFNSNSEPFQALKNSRKKILLRTISVAWIEHCKRKLTKKTIVSFHHKNLLNPFYATDLF